MRRLLVPAIRAAMVAALLLGAGALTRGPEPDRPLATVGRAGVEPATTTPGPAPALAPAPTTTTSPKPRADTRSATVVRADAEGIAVVNQGSAGASSGGNTVIGPPSAQGPSGTGSGVTVNEGPVTAVGNSSEVRIRP